MSSDLAANDTCRHHRKKEVDIKLPNPNPPSYRRRCKVAGMSSASSRMEEEKRWKKNKKPVDEGMATPPSDGRKKKKRKNSRRPHYEASNGEFAEEGGKGRKHEREPDAYQSAVEAGGFKQNDKKNKHKKKRKQLEQQQEQPEDVGEEKRKCQTQKRRRQQDQLDEGKKNKKKKRAREGDGKGSGEPDGRRRNLITDERFAAAHSDPRFQRLPQRESRVTIDDRFSGMFSNKAFFSSSAPVDKRGKPKKKKSQNPLLHYYLREEGATPTVEEEDIEDDNRASLLDEEPESSTLEEDDPDGPGADSDMSSSTEEEDDGDESDQHAENSDAYQFWMANQGDATTIENETHRLAVVNMDWDHIKAVDLYVMMSTCLLTSCPQNGGQILLVAIYPSEFGLKCMEIEAIRGPHALFDDGKNVDDDDDDNESDDDIVNEKIRSYQLNRLKYYYAVVECDSSATANHLYNSLDGIEFLKTANVLDLRFIPDTMEFKHPPRDIAAEAPPDYKQPDFETIALQHSNVKLTWDDDEPDRKKTLRQKFNPKKMDELEQYLASDDSDDDDDENEVHGDKYNALLQSADASGADEDDDTGKEMEVTFLAGVENLSKHIDKNKLKKSEEGVWDAYLRRRREKIKAKKNRKFSSDEDTSDSEYNETPHQPDDFFVEEPSDYDTQDDKKGRKKGSLKVVNRSNMKNRRDSHEKDREEETREASRAELELLLADDDGTNGHLKGFNLRPKKAKGKKGKEVVPMEDKLPDVDATNDPRFSSRLTSHLFALDPTDSQYKRSATGMRKAQVQKQLKNNTRALAAMGQRGN